MYVKHPLGHDDARGADRASDKYWRISKMKARDLDDCDSPLDPPSFPPSSLSAYYLSSSFHSIPPLKNTCITRDSSFFHEKLNEKRNAGCFSNFLIRSLE